MYKIINLIKYQTYKNRSTYKNNILIVKYHQITPIIINLTLTLTIYVIQIIKVSLLNQEYKNLQINVIY